jgi:hypothetical protein
MASQQRLASVLALWNCCLYSGERFSGHTVFDYIGKDYVQAGTTQTSAPSIKSVTGVVVCSDELLLILQLAHLHQSRTVHSIFTGSSNGGVLR